MEFNLDTTIKELLEHNIISVRTFNCLNTAGYETLGIMPTDQRVINMAVSDRKSRHSG